MADAAVTAGSIDIRIGADAPPWRLTFEFLNDVYTVLRQTWLVNRPDEDFDLVIVDLSDGSKHFKGEARAGGRKRQGGRRAKDRRDDYINLSQQVYVHVPSQEYAAADRRDRRDIGPRDLLAAGAVLIGAAIGAGGLQAQLAASETTAMPNASVVPPHPERIDRMQRYINLHAENVVMEITTDDGSRLVLMLGDVDATLRDQTLSELELVEIPDLLEDRQGRLSLPANEGGSSQGR